MTDTFFIIILSPSVKDHLAIHEKITGIFQTTNCLLFLLRILGFQPGSEKDLFCVYSDSFNTPFLFIIIY